MQLKKKVYIYIYIYHRLVKHSSNQTQKLTSSASSLTMLQILLLSILQLIVRMPVSQGA